MIFYSNFEAVCNEFSTFAAQTSGTLFYCADDPRLADLYGGQPEAVTFGFHSTADYRAEIQPDHSFIVWRGEGAVGRIYNPFVLARKTFPTGWRRLHFLHHNGFSAEEIANAVAGFRGVERRQQEIFHDESFSHF